tara:strand:- start:364 stop:1005 length:642 start_codon:yes stop_codon:yes gene_type:complete
MKVKIKKEGKKKTYNTINSWADVTLETWLKVIDLETGTKTKEAKETIAALSDIPNKVIDELSLRDVALIMGKLAELQSEQDTVLKKIIELEGKQYAFHPDLSNITLGEYADIETFIKDGLDKNIPELMAILFRPIVEKDKEVYAIAAYDGEIAIRAEKMKQMSAEQVQSALVFFWTFVITFSETLHSFLMEQTQEMTRELKMEILPKDGGGSE